MTRRLPALPLRRSLPTLLALCATVALSSTGTQAAAPEPGALPVGPPDLMLARTPSLQLRLARNPRLRALAARWDHAWTWRFDERTGRPYSAALPGIPTSLADDLVEDLLDTLTTDRAHRIRLGGAKTGRSGERWVSSAVQVHDGLPMFGTELALFAQSGQIHAVRMAVVDPPREIAPPGAELWWPHEDANGRVSWVPATRTEGDDLVHIWDMDGALLYRWTERIHATVELTHDERKPGDALVTSPLVDVEAEDEVGVSLTDAAGVHSASDPYSVRMEGDRLVMRDYQTSGGPTPSWTELEGDVELVADEDLTFAAADTWHHTKVVEAWLEGLNPDHAILDIQVRANVNIGSFRCNAYYTRGTINFARKSGPCANTGRLADVIYHEYGHGVHHYGLLAGSFAGDLSEGTADYISATILEDPRVGLGFFNDSRSLRDISIDRVYPGDYRRQVHNDGRIWSSFLWNLRAQWAQTYGEARAKELTDQLLLNTMSQGPALTTVGDAVIIADDDDGDLSNGTPHACELAELLDQHGIGPGPIGVVEIQHEPIERAGSFDPGYPIDFGVYDAMADCSGLDRESVAVWWTTDAITDEDVVDAFIEGEGEEATPASGPTFTSAGGATWNRLETTGDEIGDYLGTIPRQLATTEIAYFIEARSQDGSVRVNTHNGWLDNVYRFRVGEMEAIWCEDFEGIDAPFDPNAPVDTDVGDTDVFDTDAFETDLGGTDLETDVMDTDVEPVDGGWEASTGTPWDAGADSHVNEWAVGTPGEALWSPDAAFSGEAIVATNLDGLYRNRNSQYLRSPPLAVPEEGRALVLSFRRWLTVEDSRFDKARVYVDEEELWQQGSTATGNSGGTHTLDTRWTLFEIDAEELRGQEVRLTWTLSSDPGLEFGGWSIDDVCVERLSDVPGLHRPRDFVLSIDENDVVSASWTQPWIAPLDEVVVVRKRGGLPTGLEDGIWVYQQGTPEPGSEGAASDSETETCTTYGYAVFVRGDGVWYDAVIDGENAGTIATSCGETPDTGLPDPVDPSVDGEVGGVASYELPPVEGCGCRAAPLGGVPWLGVFGLLLWARRRRK